MLTRSKSTVNAFWFKPLKVTGSRFRSSKEENRLESKIETPTKARNINHIISNSLLKKNIRPSEGRRSLNVL